MSNSFNPKVSIIIPVYNGSNYLKEAIDSALSQSYNNLEVIVVNDGSTDEGKTDRICRSYGDSIRYFVKENGGVATALNMGIEKMEGEYFSWLSHDDIYYPDKVEKQIQLLSRLKNKETVIYSRYEIINSEGEKISEVNFEDEYRSNDLNKPLFPFFHLLLNGCTMLIHKVHFNRVGNFKKELPTTQDYDLWFRILQSAELSYEGSIVLKSRVHQGQVSRANIEKHIKECNIFWKKAISSTSDATKSSLSGSVVEFYGSLYESFKSKTLYNEVILYLERMILEEYLSLYRKSEGERDKVLEKISKHIYEKNPSIQLIEKLLQFHTKKRPRIVFFTGNWYDRGGMNRVISTITSLLSDKYDIVLCTVKEEGNENGYKLDSKVKFLEIEEYDFLRIPKLLRLLDSDIFVGSNNCFIPLLNLYEEIEELGTRVIMWNHENYFLPFYDLDLREVNDIRKEVYKKVSAIVWLSEISAKVCSVFSEKVFHIDNPISINLPRELEKRDKIEVLLSVGRFDSKQKRMDRLLEVFSIILRQSPNIKLYVVGSYDLNMRTAEGERLSNLIKRLKIPKGNVVFTGEVKNVEDYYTKASLNIIPSEREGFGLTVIEAASFGIPSIVFDDGGPAEIIKDGIDGYVVKNGDLNVMAERILGLVNDDKKYQALSEASLKIVSRYDRREILSKWISLIEMVLGSEEVGRDNSESDELTKRIVEMYENAIEKQMEDIQTNMRNSWSWKITNFLSIVKNKLMVVRRQGILLTVKNLALKLRKVINLV